MNEPSRFDRLSRRHRDCLRGVRALKGSKEIAAELGIEKSTVDGYLTEAVRLIGARNRRDAALQWAEHDARQPMLAASEDAILPLPETPDKIGGDFVRLVAAPRSLPDRSSPDEMIVGAPGGSGDAAYRRSPGFGLPFRRKGQRDNDLSVGDRLIWIPAIAVGIAIGFGMLMIGLQVLTGLIGSVANHLS